MDLGLKDKVVVIGGGAGSIGSALYIVLKQEGAEVIVADIKRGIDLSNPLEVERFFNGLKEKHQKLDGYCSLVCGGGAGKGFLKTTPAEIDQEIKGTFLAALYPVQSAVKWMKETGGGHIAIVSSINSVLGLNECAYDLAKGAVNRIGPDIAASCGQYGIYAVTLCPGTIGGTPSWQGREKDLKRIANAIPDKKVTETREAASAIAFLLSEHAEIFNGCILSADRGWHLRPMEWKKEE